MKIRGEWKVLEKNFENVLHRYPELIEEGLKFSGRQVSVGGKFVDLLFVDRFGQKLIIELKKGVIKREHIAQLLDYEGHFLTTENPNIRVMLIGNRVPMNLRNALDHHGFEWKEIPVSELISFLKNKNDAELLEEFKEEQTTLIETKTVDKSVTSTSKIRGDVSRAHNKGHNWDHNQPYNQDGIINSFIKDGVSINSIIEQFKRKFPEHEDPDRRVKGHIKHLEREHNDFPFENINGYLKKKDI
jgi:hypothetical protein